MGRYRRGGRKWLRLTWDVFKLSLNLEIKSIGIPIKINMRCI